MQLSTSARQTNKLLGGSWFLPESCKYRLPQNKVQAAVQPLPLFEIQMKEHKFLCALLKVAVSYVTISLCMHMLC